MLFTKKLKAVLITLLILLFFAGFFLQYILSDKSKAFLSVNKPVVSKIAVIEGWIPTGYLYNYLDHHDLNMYEKILITGTMFKQNVLLATNGIYSLHFPDSLLLHRGNNKIVLFVSGSDVDGIYPFIKVMLDHKMVYDNYIKKHSKYRFEFNSDSLTGKPDLEIHYTNDAYSKWEDRNLTINKIIINGKVLSARSKYATLKLGHGHTAESVNFHSFAEQTAYFLEKKGTDKDKIVVLNTNIVKLSNTLSSAAQAIKWLKKNGYHTVNVITLGIHARRTWASYKKLINPKLFTIGIQAIPQRQYGRIHKFLTRSWQLIRLWFLWLIPKPVIHTMYW